MRLKPKLVGKAVVLSDGKVGTVEIVSLDEDHGLRISIGAMSEAGPFQQSNSRKVRSGMVVPVGNLIRLASEAESRNVSIL
jgi:sporulation protein YlmC with PRC-barrel domain